MRDRRLLKVSISATSLVFLILMGSYLNSSLSRAGAADVGTVPLADRNLWQGSGYITMLRVHDVGTGFGPGSDFLDGEVVIRLDSQEGNSFGFQLRDDGNRPAREGMLGLLRDAFNHDWIVTVDYWLEPDKTNGEIIRVWLTKPVIM